MKDGRLQMTCIVCPMGCELTAEVKNGEVISLTGNHCRRGEAYAVGEVKEPRRNISTTVAVRGGTEGLVSVKTASPIPKELIFKVMDALSRVTLEAPVRPGETVLSSVCGSGCDIITTAAVASRQPKEGLTDKQ